MTGFC